MDIGLGENQVADKLSNFTAHTFYVDGIQCNSMEGFLQSLKFQDPEEQKEVCLLVGIKAKRRGSKQNKNWKVTQKLFWKSREIHRHGAEYQFLLDEAFIEMARNPDFKEDLLATGQEELTHSIGRVDPKETVLTISEFCNRLMNIREVYLKNGEVKPVVICNGCKEKVNTLYILPTALQKFRGDKPIGSACKDCVGIAARQHFEDNSKGLLESLAIEYHVYEWNRVGVNDKNYF